MSILKNWHLTNGGWKYTRNLLLGYQDRSNLTISETFSGSSRNASILPAIAQVNATNYLYGAYANFESAETSGYVEVRWYQTNVTDSGTLFASCDEATDTRYFKIRVVSGRVMLDIRQNVTTVFYNRIFTTNQVSTGWHTARITCSGSAYTISVDSVNQALTVGDGLNDGRWINLITLRDNVTIGCARVLSGYEVSSTWYIDYVDFSNKHIWNLSGVGNYEFDRIGSTHLTWTGSAHTFYTSEGSQNMLVNGHSVWTKAVTPTEYVPYNTSGVPIDVSAFLSTYSKRSDHAGSVTAYNFAPSLVDFDPTNSAHASLTVFNKSNSTYHISTGSMLYYDAGEVYRWRNDELENPAIYSDTYKKVGYKGMLMLGGTTTGTIVRNISTIYAYSTDNLGYNEWQLARYCGLSDLVVQSGGQPVYDVNNYLTWV